METTDQEKHIPQKPKQVTLAFYLLLASSAIGLLLSIATAIIFWHEYYSSRPLSAVYWGLMNIIPFWIAFKINAGRNWARLFLAALTVISLFGIPDQLRSFSEAPAQLILLGISYTLLIVAMILLFQRPSNAWYKHQAVNKTPYDPFITEKRQPGVTRKKTWKIPFSQKTEGYEGHTGNVLLTASLGAITPQVVMFILFLFGNSLREAEYIYYTMCLTCLPAVLLGLIIGGLLSLLAKGSKIDRKVIAVAYICGLIGGLIPLSLIMLYDYLTAGTVLP